MTSQETKKSKRTWTPLEEDALVECLKELEGTIHKQDGVFKAGYLKELEDKMNFKIPGCGILKNPHIDSKLRWWKKHYNAISTLLSYSGAGWNDTTKMVTIEAEGTWDDMIKKVSGASDVKKKSFRLYDDWVEIFGKDRATGELAETPIEEEIERMKNSSDNKCDNNLDTDSVNIDVINKGTERKNNDKKRKRRSGGEWESNMEHVIQQAVTQFSQETNKSVELMATRLGADYDASKKREEVNSKIQ